jgi:uroporphyrin-III C-methyltransferase
MAGRVAFVGAGPGAADLITVRGARLLGEADVVLADALVAPSLREQAPQAEWIAVGKRGYAESTRQARINTLLVECAQRHPLVVRLKGGDPSVFGRLEEELAALAANGIACEVVPGITAALAAAAATRRPLTRRGVGRSVLLATAMTRDGAPPKSRRADTEVFYMASRQIDALRSRLLADGWPATTPVIVVSHVGWPDQVVSDHVLRDMSCASSRHAGGPTLVIVGTGATAVDLGGAGAPIDGHPSGAAGPAP